MDISLDVYEQPNWTRTASIFEIAYLSLKDSFSDIVYSQMKLSRTATNVGALKLNSIVVINDNDLPANRYGYKTLIVEEITDDQESTYIEYNLRPLKAILSQRVVLPFSDITEYDVQYGQHQIIDMLVQRNAINSTNTSRNFNMVTTYDQGTDLIYWSGEYGQLSDEISKICKMSDIPLGWNVRPEINASGFVTGRMLFYSKLRDDKQSSIIFSDFADDFKNVTYRYSKKDFKNVAYAIGKNKDEYNPWNDPGGWGRYEVDLDTNQRSIAGQKYEAKSYLKERRDQYSYTVELNPTGHLHDQFDIDWFVGSRVTVNLNGVSSVELISETEQIWEDNEYTMNITFGEDNKTFAKQLRNEMAQKYGKRKYDRISGDIIWSGAMLMQDGQTITIDDTKHTEHKLNEVDKGWTLVWSDIDTGGIVNDWDFYTTHIGKHTKRNVTHALSVGIGNDQSCTKILTFTDKTIIGNAYNNSTTATKDAVLREVRVW